jgi:oxaloacetate decarboxylase alpha subunit
MMGTLRRQLADMRRPELLPAVLEEIAQVRAELGYPIMVTPYSQFVGSQAVMNVLAADAGRDRWTTVPDEVIRYVLGHFGPAPGEIAAIVRERVAASSRTRELDVPAREPSIKEVLEQAQKSLGRAVDEDEALLRAVLPVEQLDAIVRPAPRWAPGESSVADFLAGVEALPNWRRLEVTLGDCRIALRRAPGHPGIGGSR